MAHVIHKGKYLYDHYRQDGKVKSKYIGKSTDGWQGSKQESGDYYWKLKSNIKGAGGFIEILSPSKHFNAKKDPYTYQFWRVDYLFDDSKKYTHAYNGQKIFKTKKEAVSFAYALMNGDDKQIYR